ncbi:pyridoxal phosphate-dependent aminotransferase [Microvirga massiliensis]|uniref:pyridoxal phosphate-dependent aminotransferase n=1 Tax=Microvirga massiliensis TaxID=1033741 RepID=UPI00062BE510|nr:aminotransferase class I/II-fold pyridoxal phosphate-dependent enzyme [Microvirga massiliensis]
MTVLDIARVRPLADRATTMPRSAIREIMMLAAGRSDVFHLEVGEPEFGTPDWIVDEAFRAVRAGATRYTPNSGTQRLRAAIAGRVGAKFGRGVEPDRVAVTTGAIGALFSAIFAVVDPGDEVLLPDPGWPNYESIVHLSGARAVRYAQPAGQGFLPDPAAMERLIGPRTKAIVISTPGNPTGAVFPRKIMEEIGRLAVRHGLYLISDEVYEDFVFEGEHVSALEVAPDDRVIVVSGFSKSYAMTGWRLGYLVCPPTVAAVAGAIQEPVTSCPSAPSQAAAEAALAGDQSVIGRFCDIYRRRRDILVEVFDDSSALPVVPQGAFYGFIAIGASGERSLAFAKRLLQEQSVAAVPGITFGPQSDGFIRVAFTVEDSRFREALRRLRGAIG